MVPIAFWYADEVGHGDGAGEPKQCSENGDHKSGDGVIEEGEDDGGDGEVEEATMDQKEQKSIKANWEGESWSPPHQSTPLV